MRSFVLFFFLFFLTLWLFLFSFGFFPDMLCVSLDANNFILYLFSMAFFFYYFSKKKKADIHFWRIFSLGVTQMQKPERRLWVFSLSNNSPLWWIHWMKLNHITFDVWNPIKKRFFFFFNAYAIFFCLRGWIKLNSSPTWWFCVVTFSVNIIIFFLFFFLITTYFQSLLTFFSQLFLRMGQTGKFLARKTKF